MVPGFLCNVLFLSPHCDDVVLSCGQLLETCPGSIVATIFAGSPAAGAPITEWDLAGGFRPGDDVMNMRRAEDAAALTLLGGVPLWLNFHDRQYGPPHSPSELQAAVTGLIESLQPAVVFIPLGLFHSDHISVHEAALRAAPAQRGRAWFLYEDAIYRRLPGLVEERVRLIKEKGIDLEPISFPVRCPSERKMQAVECYRSQVRALSTKGRPGHRDALAPEQYWRVMLPPHEPRA